MSAPQILPLKPAPTITWEKLPDNFILPDDPVANNLQPLLAFALRESFALAGLILDSMLIASNFGLSAIVNGVTVVKAPDWVYVPSVYPIALGKIRRSYSPQVEGDRPAIALEFISETDGGEYSINPHYPYGKWYFYEQILQVHIYGIFQPKTGELEIYHLIAGKYEQQLPDENQRYWIAEINLFLGVWWGKKDEVVAYWLRWWDRSGNLLLWGNERLAQERQQAEQTSLQVERLAQKLRELGIDPETL